jgi:hypothetical protein
MQLGLLQLTRDDITPTEPLMRKSQLRAAGEGWVQNRRQLYRLFEVRDRVLWLPCHAVHVLP